MNKPASGKQSQLDDEKEHARLGQPGWHERRIRDVSPGGSLIACSARLIVKLLLPDAGLLFCKAKAGGRLVRARLPAKSMNSVFEREPCAERKRKSGPGPGAIRARWPAKPMNSVSEREPRAGVPKILFLRNLKKLFLYSNVILISRWYNYENE